MALGKEQLLALKWAWEGDGVSAFGSIIAFNSTVTKDSATWIREKFIEVVVAPDFSPSALEVLSAKKNLRLLALPPSPKRERELSLRSIDGGFLLQEDGGPVGGSFTSVTKRVFPEEKKDLATFGEVAVKHLKSNAVALVEKKSGGEGYHLSSAGMGQPNRLACIELALARAKEKKLDSLKDAILVSDGFLPFSDNVEAIYRGGVEYIVQPGGKSQR